MERIKTRFDILKVKHWQLVVALYASAIVVSHIGMYAGFYWPYPWASDPFTMIIGALYFAYPMLIWKRLSELLVRQPLFERADRKKVFVALFVAIGLPMILPLSPFELPPILAGLVFLFCLAFVSAVPAKQLKSIELKRNAGLWEYVPEAFQFFFWPLGAFWLQPRINDLQEKPIIIRE